MAKNCQSFFAKSKVKSIPQHSSDLQEQDLNEISISSSPSSLPLSTPTSPSSTNSSMNEPTPVSSLSSSTVSSKKVLEKPIQVQLRADIALEKDILLGLHRKRDSAMLTEADRKELKLRGENLIDLEKKLNAAMENQRKQQNYRNNQKRRIESLDDETRKKVKGKIVTKVGQPSKYDEDLLISVISKIAISGNAAHEKRRNEVIRTDLKVTLQSEGFNLSRSGIYLHLLPRNSRSREGKRHAAPVKLIRAQNDSHAKHEATKFVGRPFALWRS